MPPITEGLFVELKLIADEWSKGIKDAQKEAKELEKSFQPLKQAALDLGAPMAAAGAAIVASIGAAAKVTADYGDMLNDARQQTGLSVESLAKLKFAADQSGSSFEGMTTGLRFLSKNLELAAQGGDQQQKAFKDLGIAVKDSSGHLKTTEVILGEVADRFATMEDGSAKSTLAMQLFGKAGADLIPTLNAGSAGLAAMGAAAERAGVVISGDTATASDAFNDKLVELDASVKGITLTVGSVFLPIIADLATKLVDAVQGVRAWTAAHPELIKAVGGLGVALTGAGGLLLGLAGVLTIIPKINAALLYLAANPIVAATAAIAGLVAAIIYFRREIAGSLLFALSKAVEGFAKFVGVAAKVADAVGADGIAGKLKGMQFSIEETAQHFDDLSNDALIPAKIQTDALTESLKKQTPELSKSAAELKRLADEAKKLSPIQQSLKTDMETITDSAMRLNKQLDDEQRALAAADRAMTIAQGSTKAMAAATREWGDTIATLNAGLQTLPVNTRAAANDLLLLKPPEINIGPSKEELDAAHQRYEDLFNSVKDTAKHAFLQMFEDGKFHFSALADVAKGIFETLWTEILSSLTAQLLTPLVGKITGALSGVLGKIPGLGGVLGGGAGTATQAAGSLGGAGGAVSGVAGAGFSLAGSLITGGLSALGGLAGGILGNDRGAQRETAQNTGETKKVLVDTLEQVLWPQFNLINFMANSTIWGERPYEELGYWSTQVANVTAQSMSIAADRIVAAIQDLNGRFGSTTTNTTSSGSDVGMLVRDINNYVQYGGGLLIASRTTK